MVKSIDFFLNELRRRLESAIPNSHSTIQILNKPSVMGNEGWLIDCELGNNSVTIFFWSTGIYEIYNSFSTDEKGDIFYRCYTPDDHENLNFPLESFDHLKNAIDELILNLNEKFGTNNRNENE